MTLDDFVMLGTTVPEPCHDGRVFVCSAGVSAELGGLVRVYPLARRCVPHRWGVFRVPLERNPEDARRESFKVRGDRRPGEHERINGCFEPLGNLPDSARARLLRPCTVASIADANARRASLALLRPIGGVEVVFRHNPDSPDSPQLRLFEEEHDRSTVGSRRFPFQPYLRFADDDGEHALQIRDWGAYEFIRKHLDEPDYYRGHLAAALHLSPSSCLLVGNMSHQRTTWLVISVLNHVLPGQQLELGLDGPIEVPA